MGPADPYMSRGYEPIHMECDQAHLTLEGTVPGDLDGTFYRIGPNPQFPPRATYNPLFGDGMVHAFRVREGRVSYRNRWIRTRQWTLEHAAGRALFGPPGDLGGSDPTVAGVQTDGVANTNLVWHAGRLLALEEGHAPLELAADSLETLGAWSFEGRLPRNMTAHPKIDPTSGEMIFFANFPTGRPTGEIELYVASSSGELVRRERIQGPFPAMVHDFAITRDFLVVPICPATVSLERARAGRPLIAWEPARETHLAILPRKGPAGDVRWFVRTPCMVWHLMNAFNEGSRILVDVCQQDAAQFPLADGSPPDERGGTQRLFRWKVDWEKPGDLLTERLSDLRCEYPRIDERRSGLPYRHGYLACHGGPGSGDIFHRGIAHFDHGERRMRSFHAGAHCAVAEPVFVPSRGGSVEGDGYLLTNIFDERRNASHLAIFAAAEIERGPIARAHLDHRVPVGFHGLWRPASGSGSSD